MKRVNQNLDDKLMCVQETFQMNGEKGLLFQAWVS